METGQKVLNIFLHAAHIHFPQHVPAHEVRNAVHLLHGHGLLEKVQRIVLGNTEEGFKLHRIFAVIIENVHIGQALQLFFRSPMLVPKFPKSWRMDISLSPTTKKRAGFSLPGVK